MFIVCCFRAYGNMTVFGCYIQCLVTLNMNTFSLFKKLLTAPAFSFISSLRGLAMPCLTLVAQKDSADIPVNMINSLNAN